MTEYVVVCSEPRPCSRSTWTRNHNGERIMSSSDPSTQLVAALFVSRKGPYWGRPDVDSWDEERDARNYAGPWPVVAHPPCSCWSSMAGVVEARRGHPRGEDGGCFESALLSVQTYGGVLEQPAGSNAWARFELGAPLRQWWRVEGGRAGNGWVCEVSQSAYGHRARKRTWIYYVGRLTPVDLDWSNPKGEAVVSYCRRRGNGTIWHDDRPRLSKLQASLTPPAFADVLLSLARVSR